MFCTDCGCDLSSTARFCTACGTTSTWGLPSASTTGSERFCTSCGSRLASGAGVCASCGQAVLSMTWEPTLPAPDRAAPSPRVLNPSARHSPQDRSSPVARSPRRMMLKIGASAAALLLGSIGVAVWAQVMGSVGASRLNSSATASQGVGSSPVDTTTTSADAVALPAPPVSGEERAALLTVPYLSQVPEFPAALEGYRVASRGSETVRVFEWGGWKAAFPYQWGLNCTAEFWIVRWRSQSSAVEVRASVGTDLDPTRFNAVQQSGVGGAGYIAGGSCVMPALKFERIVSGRDGSLVDVDVEYEVWSYTGKIK